jgi:hypothetical protein
MSSTLSLVCRKGNLSRGEHSSLTRCDWHTTECELALVMEVLLFWDHKQDGAVALWRYVSEEVTVRRSGDVPAAGRVHQGRGSGVDGTHTHNTLRSRPPGGGASRGARDRSAQRAHVS